MKVPRNLHGRDLADHLIRRWNYAEVHQTGSHIILRTMEPLAQSLPIPAHKPLLLGTLVAILRMVAEHKGVTRDQILYGL